MNETGRLSPTLMYTVKIRNLGFSGKHEEENDHREKEIVLVRTGSDDLPFSSKYRLESIDLLL